MSENAKTITFVALGLCAVLLGLASRPSSAEVDDASLAGTDLTKNFNIDDAKRLKIVRFDEDTAKTREFEVAEVGGLWSIPSKEGYPADAVKQMAEAATSLVDRKILSVASQSAADHEAYGVIDPLSSKLDSGQKGVGTRVTMSSADGKALADLIIGKSVRDAEGQRYVREAGRDVVYVIEIDPAKLSTNFEDWIEKDLLKLNGWDLQQVEVKDYSAELVQGMTPDGRLAIGIDRRDGGDFVLAYNDADAKWQPVKMQRFETTNGKDGKYVDFQLAADEELNDETLTALKNALDDLKIVDVVHKPAGLSNDLKAGSDFLNSREAQIDLMSKGFTALAPQKEGGEAEILSSDGEVIATMKDGTEYVLRFGNLTDVDSDGEMKADDSAAGEAKTDTPADKASEGEKDDVHRYLFVMARLNKDAVKRPDLEKLPELPPGAEDKAGEKSEEKASDAATEDETKANAAEPKDSDAAKDEEKAVADKADEAKAEPAKADESKDESKDAAKADDKAEAKDDVEAKKGDEEAKRDEAGEKKEPGKDSELEKLIAERKRIEDENQRKLKEYEELLKKGEENVKNLNLRFGDWYFVVDDEVFKKVRVGLDKVIKKQDKKSGEAGAAAPGGAAPPAGIPGIPQIPGAGK